jgi:hypothetical protein
MVPMSLSSEDEPLLIIPDLHAHPEIARAIHSRYGDEVSYWFNGDFIDGPDTKGMIQQIIDMNGHVILGNHEQYLLAAMLENEEAEGGAERRYENTFMWYGVHDRVLESYGIYDGPTPGSAVKLRRKMETAGHLAILASAPLFYENDTIVAIHGDITSEDWVKQRADLEAEKLRNLQGQYWGYSTEPGHERLMPFQMGERHTQPIEAHYALSGLTKRVLSGHFHVHETDPVSHIINNGRHILLAGGFDQGYTFVYESWHDQLQLITVD